MRPDLLAVVRAHPEIGFTIAVMGWPTDRGGRRRDPRQLELHHRSLCPAFVGVTKLKSSTDFLGPCGVDHRVGEGARRLLRQIVAYAALDGSMGVPAGELAGIGRRLGVRRTVCVALEGDRWNR